jgi:hypothetical protein
MKRFTLLTGIALLISLGSFAQEIENKLPEKFSDRLDKLRPITDTLIYNLPNDGKLVLLFNNEEYVLADLKEKFNLVMKETKDFPEFKTLTYRLSEENMKTNVNAVILELEKNYIPFSDQLILTFPIGLDYTGGDFTPELGFKAFFNWRKFSLGGSITNTIYFPTRIDNNIKVNSNWFLNLEFGWDRSKPVSNSKNIFGAGILLDNTNSEIFSGTTIRGFYRRSLNGNISIQVGIIGTENFKTFYPTIGIRFW